MLMEGKSSAEQHKQDSAFEVGQAPSRARQDRHSKLQVPIYARGLFTSVCFISLTYSVPSKSINDALL